MPYATTTDGIARLGADGSAVLLDTQYSSLGEAIEADALNSLVDAAELPRQPEHFTLRAPTRPRRIVLIRLNYQSHVREMGRDMPTDIKVMLPPASTVNDPDGQVVLPPDHPDHVDYEAEFAVIISREARGISARDAWGYIAGLTACNDVSCRDVQEDVMASGKTGLDLARALGMAKGFPTFKPIGPGLLLTRELAFPLDVPLSCRVNGEVRQKARVGDLIFGIPEIVEAVSQMFPLHPGDVISTGTPAGVGWKQGTYLRDGDVVEVQVGGLPPLRNFVVGAVTPE